MAPVCFVCGEYSSGSEEDDKDKLYLNTLYTRPGRFGHAHPFFPFLQRHPKPEDADPLDGEGAVKACNICHTTLIEQWNLYERNNTPLSKRLYWLKRVDNQSFTGSDANHHELGRPHEQDLDMENSSANPSDSHSVYSSPPIGVSRETPSPDRRRPSSQERQVPRRPRDLPGSTPPPLIMSRGPPKKFHSFESKYLSSASSSSSSSSSLSHPLPLLSPSNQSAGSQRNDAAVAPVNNAARPTPDPSSSNLLCFTCGKSSITSDMKVICAKERYKGSAHFPFLASRPCPAGAIALNGGEDQTRVCLNCYKSLNHQWRSYELMRQPEAERDYKIPSCEVSSTTDRGSRDGGSPSLVPPSIPPPDAGRPTIRRSSSASPLSVAPPRVTSSVIQCYTCANPIVSNDDSRKVFAAPNPENRNQMFFPFLERITLPNGIPRVTDKEAATVCSTCFSWLKCQWKANEEARIPQERREYTLPGGTAATGRKNAESDDRGVDYAKVTETSSSSALDARLIRHRTLRCAPVDDAKVISTPSLILTSPACFVCGFAIKSGDSCTLKSSPPKDIAGDRASVSPTASSKAFFPFLASWDSPQGEKVKEDGSVAVCRFCNDNLCRQWDNYEAAGDKDRWLRHYDPRLFFCFLCGVETLRARVKRISKDQFPFILNHTPPLPEKCLYGPKNEWCLVCHTCYIDLQQQFKEYEKMRLPEHYRKYNWRQIPLEHTLPLQKEERRRKDTSDSQKDHSEIEDCVIKEDSNSNSCDFASNREDDPADLASSRMSVPNQGSGRSCTQVDSTDSQPTGHLDESQDAVSSRGTPAHRLTTSSPCASSLSIKREMADSSASSSHSLPNVAHRRSPTQSNPQSPVRSHPSHSPHRGNHSSASSSASQPSSSSQPYTPQLHLHQQQYQQQYHQQHHQQQPGRAHSSTSLAPMVQHSLPLAHHPAPHHGSLPPNRPASSHPHLAPSPYGVPLPPPITSSSSSSTNKHPSPYLPTRPYASSSSPSRSSHRHQQQDGGADMSDAGDAADGVNNRRARSARPDEHSANRSTTGPPQDVTPYIAAVWPASGYAYPNFLEHLSQMPPSPFVPISSTAGRYPTELLRIQNNTQAALIMEERRKEEERREEERRREEESRREEERRAEERREERRKREEEHRRVEELRRIEERRQREEEERRAMERRSEERRREEERKKNVERESYRLRVEREYQSYFQAQAQAQVQAHVAGDVYPQIYADTSSNSGVVDLRKRLSPSHSMTPPNAHDRPLVPRHATPPSGMELDLRVRVGESSRHLGASPSHGPRAKVSPRDRQSPSRSRSGSRDSGRDVREMRRDQVPPPPPPAVPLPPPLPPQQQQQNRSRSPSVPRLHSAESLFRPYDRAAETRLHSLDSRLAEQRSKESPGLGDLRHSGSHHVDPNQRDARLVDPRYLEARLLEQQRQQQQPQPQPQQGPRRHGDPSYPGSSSGHPPLENQARENYESQLKPHSAFTRPKLLQQQPSQQPPPENPEPQRYKLHQPPEQGPNDRRAASQAYGTSSSSQSRIRPSVVDDSGAASAAAAAASAATHPEAASSTSKRDSETRREATPVRGASADPDLVRSSLAQRVMSQMSASSSEKGSDGKWRSSSNHSSQDVRRREADRNQVPVKLEPSCDEESVLSVVALKKSPDEYVAPTTSRGPDAGERVPDPDGAIASISMAETEAAESAGMSERQEALKTPSPPPRPLVSSLDKAQLLMAEARRLRKRRRKASAAAAAAAAASNGKGGGNNGATKPPPSASGAETEDEEEEEGEADREELEGLMKELEELDEWRRARCSLVTVWPKKFDENEDVEQDENKMQYVAALGLRTKRAAADARWEMRVRSKRLRREESVSPLIVEEDKFDESKKGGPLWDDVSLSLLESELRGGMDLTNGIPPIAPAELARVKRMGVEGYMGSLGLRPKRRRPIADSQPSSSNEGTTADLPSQTEVQPPNASSNAPSTTEDATTDASAKRSDRPAPGAPSSDPPLISLDDDDSTSATDAPNMGASVHDGGTSLAGRTTKPLFTTSTKDDEKMNEFAREFHQSVLFETTRQHLGQLSPSVPESRKSSQEQSGGGSVNTTSADQDPFADPSVDENWRKFFESYCEYLKGIGLNAAESIASRMNEEEGKVDGITRTLKEKIKQTLKSTAPQTESTADD